MVEKPEDKRNIADAFRGLSVEEIRAILDARRRPFATLMLNIDYDINVAGIVRTHNVFCGQEIFYLGRKRYNRQGTVGTYHYEHLHYFETLEAALKEIPAHYTWVGVDSRPGAQPIHTYKWPDRPLLVFGHEQGGLDFLPELPKLCQDIVYIPQAGSCRSLNVSVAGGIAYYDLAFKRGWLG